MSDKDEDEANKALNAIIRAERVREYVKGGELAQVHLVLEKSGKFTLILSVYESKETGGFARNVMSAFGMLDSKVTPVSLYGNAKGNIYESTAYWQEILPELLSINMKERLPFYKIDRQTERFYLEDDLKQLFVAVLQAKKKSIKAVLMNVWGRILSANLKQTSILLEDIHEGGTLSHVPLVYQNDLPLEQAYASMKEQLVNAEMNDMCSYEKLDSMMAYKLAKRTLVSQELCYDTKYDLFLSRVKDNTLYKFNPREFSEAPLYIRYNIVNDELSVTYDFDYDYFDNINVEDLHILFCKVLQANLLGHDLDVNATLINTHADTSMRLRIRDMKAKCLSKIELFSGYAEEEYKELADKFTVVHKDSRQEAISQNYECDKLFIILSGRVEVDGIDSKKFVRPLLMLKDCDVFGIESLLNNKRSKLLYQVYSDEAIMLSIEVEDFRRECRRHPELMDRILEIQSDRMYKFAKLWMMS